MTDIGCYIGAISNVGDVGVVQGGYIGGIENF